MSYINENSFSRWIIEKSDGLTTLGLQKLSESVRDYAYLILTAQTSARAQIIGHEVRNLDAQRLFLNNFENVINRRVDISEDIQRFQKTLQYARSKVNYAVAEYVYLLPSDMNLRIGKIRRYNNKILIASPSFKIGTNLKINLDEEKGKPDAKSNKNRKKTSNLTLASIKSTNKILNLTPAPRESTNKILNLTSSSMEKANLIQIRSPMRKKRLL